MRIRGRLMFDYIHCFVSDRGLDHVCIKQVIYCQRWHPKALAFLCARLSLDVGIEGGCFEPADCPGMEQVNVSIQNPLKCETLSDEGLCQKNIGRGTTDPGY